MHDDESANPVSRVLLVACILSDDYEDDTGTGTSAIDVTIIEHESGGIADQHGVTEIMHRLSAVNSAAAPWSLLRHNARADIFVLDWELS